VFRVKICGIRTLDDLSAATAAGVDAIGFNFYAGSKRFISLETARSITAAVPKGPRQSDTVFWPPEAKFPTVIPAGTAKSLHCIGVFVNADIDFIRKMCSAVRLDAIQMHGNEDLKWFKSARELWIPLIRAIRCPPTVDELKAEIEKVPISSGLYDALLIDGAVAGSPADSPIYGGSGAVANWSMIMQMRDESRLPLILAGGLTPENVAEAIQTVSPDWVDVAGGVEGASGGKDADKVRAFVAAAETSLRRP
jgi:phosphoribosylanthranilate isomerase